LYPDKYLLEIFPDSEYFEVDLKISLI